MSVINKMLRDLDRRQSPAATNSAAAARPTPVYATAGAYGGGASGAAPVGASGVRVWLLALIGLVALVGVAVFTLPDGATPGATSAPAPAATRVPLLPQTSPVSPVGSVVAAAAPTVRTAASRSAPTPLSSTGRPPTAAAAPQAQSARPEKLSSAPVSASLPTATAPLAAPSLNAVAPAAAVPPAQARATAALEALAHAQAQWAQGDQSGALRVVQTVIAELEQHPGGNVDALAAAARDYVRMTLALQRPTDALALLVRLEAPLAKVADIWALRGNTAQRLGLHAQAVHAYLNALALQPGQARWLLAAAVSLAAQGQAAPAAELAEKARRAGFLPADVANYLRQAGVALPAPTSP